MPTFKKLLTSTSILIYLIGIFAPSMPVSAAMDFVPQCDAYVDTYHYNRLQVPNHPITSYFDSNTTSEQRRDIMEKKHLDDTCINLAEQKYKVKNLQDGAAKSAAQRQVEALQAQYNQLTEAQRQIEERDVRMAGMYDALFDAFYDEDFHVNKALIDKRYDILQTMTENMDEFAIQLSKNKEVIIATLQTELSKLSDASDAEILAKKEELFTKIQTQLIPLKKQYLENKQIYKNELAVNIEKKFNEQLQAYKKFSKDEFETLEEYENAVSAFEQVLIKKQEMYVKRSDQIFEATNLPLDAIFEIIEKDMGDIPSETTAFHYFITKQRDTASILPPEAKTIAKDYIEETNLSAAAKAIKDKEISMKLISIMTSADFSLMSVLRRESKKVRLIIKMVEEGDHESLERIVSESSEFFRKFIELRYDAEVRKINREINESQADIDALIEREALRPEEIEKIQAELKVLREEGDDFINTEDLDRLKSLGYEDGTVYNMIALTHAYGGYPDYIINYAKSLPEAIRSKEILVAKNKGLAIIETLKELIHPLPKKQRNLITFSVLSRLLYDHESVVTFKTSPMRNELSQSLMTEIELIKRKNAEIEDLYVQNILKVASNTEAYDLKHDMEKMMGIYTSENLLSGHTPISAKQEVQIRISSNREAAGKTVHISLSTEQEEVRKIEFANGSSYTRYKAREIIVKKSKTVIKEMYHQGSQGEILWKLDNLGIITLYKYDDLYRMTSEVKALGEALYNPQLLTFSWPTTFRKKVEGKNMYVILSYKKFEYRHDTKVLTRRQDYSPVTSKDLNDPAKTFEFTYIDQERNKYVLTGKCLIVKFLN